MTGKPMSVAFVGTGDATEANVKALLDDWMPEKDADGKNREYNSPIVPDTIKRAHKGLTQCRNWVSDEANFGADHDELPLEDIVTDLVTQRDDKDDPADVYLVFVNGGEDDPHLDVVKEAIKQGIPVKDVTAGLDDFELAEEAPAEPEKPAGRRTRGKARAEADDDERETPKLDKTVSDDPPWDTSDEAESASKGSGSSDVQTHADEADSPAAASVASPSATPAGGMSVLLSDETIKAVLHAFTLMAGDIKASVVEELPASARPKVEKHPYWVDDDGNYRKREGRGRPRKGETAVDLTDAEVAKLGL